jgi:hypothetical protein
MNQDLADVKRGVMSNTNYEEQRLALERQRLDIEKGRTEMEQKFFRKNLGVLLTAAISLAAVLVSGTQIGVAYITKEKEIEINRVNADKDQELKWKATLLNYVTANMESIFSNDKKKQSRYLSVMLSTFQTKYGYTDEVVQNISTLAAQEVPPAVTESDVNPAIGELIANFKGPDRLVASNRLTELYEKNPDAVITALIANLREADDELSYRVNLYICFTLSRITSGWKGTEQQRDRLSRLTNSKNYQDDTFKRRVDEAINNWRRL